MFPQEKGPALLRAAAEPKTAPLSREAWQKHNDFQGILQASSPARTDNLSAHAMRLETKLDVITLLLAGRAI
jgi:hypothetical protein